MEKKISTIYSNGSKYLLYALLLFSPLARGSVHYWQHTVIFLFALAILSLLLLEKGLTGKPCLYKTAVDKPIGALLLLCLVSLFFSVSKAGFRRGLLAAAQLSDALLWDDLLYSYP